MSRKLFAFDLDGTLLNSRKELSEANLIALKEIAASGAVIAFASGRLGSSMMQYVPNIGFDIAMLTLNGAEVYANTKKDSCVFHSPLRAEFADYLIDYSSNKPFALNYYIKDNLYSTDNQSSRTWIDLYHQQTRTKYHMLSTFSFMKGNCPSKVIFVGAADEMDRQEQFFKSLWGQRVYLCRTWDYYLEFLDFNANKGAGLVALVESYNIDINNVIAFGDATNDIPMLQKAGFGIALKNGHPDAIAVADKVSEWTNDEDAIAREWEILKKM